RLVEINRGRALAINLVWVDEDMRRYGVVRRVQSDEKCLLPGRLKLEGKPFAAAVTKAGIADRRRGQDLLDPRPQCQQTGILIENRPRVPVLLLGPLPYRRIGAILKPRVGVGHRGPMIIMRDRL